jgi:mannose-6-phosphate isomerase-like protein (cupin superfamily)
MIRVERRVTMRAPFLLVAGLLMCGSLPAAGQTGQQAPGGAAPATYTLQQAPTDRAVDFSREWLQNEFKNMDAAKRMTTRMLEGGKYNVNIRRITGAETALVHPITIDVWVVLEGAGTLTTGGKIVDGKIVGGVSRPIKAGDVEFIPPNVPHGVSGVQGSITWLNVRWDVDWAGK